MVWYDRFAKEKWWLNVTSDTNDCDKVGTSGFRWVNLDGGTWTWLSNIYRKWVFLPVSPQDTWKNNFTILTKYKILTFFYLLLLHLLFRKFNQNPTISNLSNFWNTIFKKFNLFLNFRNRKFPRFWNLSNNLKFSK